MSDRRPPIPGETRSVLAADGARLEYEIVGNGPPLVMLHGFLANRFAFSRQRAELAAHYRLIMIGFRGSAGSDTLLPVDYGSGTSEVDDLRCVLDAERLDRVSFFAHSSGGATAFVFATQSPERVARAVLIEPTLHALLPPTDRAKISAENAALIGVAETAGPEAALRASITMAAGEAWTQLDAETQATRLKALAESAPFLGPHNRGLETLAVTDSDVTGFRPPALLLYGANSFWFEGIIADRIRALRPDLRVLTVENAAHNVHRDRADVVNAEVLAFLSK